MMIPDSSKWWLAWLALPSLGLVLGVLKMFGLVTLSWWWIIVLIAPLFLAMAVIIYGILAWMSEGSH